MPFDPQMYNSNAVYQSWVDHPFRFVEPSDRNEQRGLRRPQLGALYTLLAHLTSSSREGPVTVVMPTGTGKTDTIAALLLAGPFPRTFVIVPSDALREQISGSLAMLKNLRAMAAICAEVKAPIIRKIDTRMTVDQIKTLNEANVIIATPQALQNFSEVELEALASFCSHLIFDEAHHVAAHTWSKVRAAFDAKPCIQFTATPFREDKKSLDGKIIYQYALRDAQADGYFKEIEFHPVREYNPLFADVAIAKKAVELLRADLADGRDHLMMVRAKSQARAKKLYDIYKEFDEIPSILIHSKVKNKDEILKDIKLKKYKIIVCVDMLGEGFDLPELKIAAIHDQHQTPAVTLQFIGRLTRVNDNLGTAKFVANIANQKMGSQMAALYEESADWSAIIREVSEEKIDREILREEFAEQFDDQGGKSILALNPSPNISARAYKLRRDDWLPGNIQYFSGFNEDVEFYSVSDKKNLVILVTRADVSVPWANTSEISNVVWVLYLAYYHEKKATLFIHCSGDDGQAKNFRSLISKNAQLIAGEKTFRTLDGLKLLKLQNVGLSRNQKNIRFTMHVGRDINSIIGDLENNTAIKSNIFAAGYLDGEKSNAGCSHKGKIWEMDSGPIDDWVNWCDRVAIKLNDDTIDVQNIINNVMRSEQIVNTWPTGLFYADWPESLLIENESKIVIKSGELSYNLLDLELGCPTLASPTELKIPLLFEKNSDEKIILSIITLRLVKDDFSYSCGDLKISVQGEINLSDYLYENPIKLLKQDGSMVFGNYRYYSPATLNILLPQRLLTVWDWKATKIQAESMRRDRDLDTVQGFTFQKISEKYTIIFNDDGAGEIADLVAINVRGGVIEVDLYHCKYCVAKDGIATPGGRVDDTYVVCGQTSRSTKWMHSGEALFNRLIGRYQKSIVSGFDRMLKGKIDDVDLARHKSVDHEMILGFYIVQPAISRAQITDEQLAVLGTSYTYVKAISGSDLNVIISK
ncbi:DEAD/DEAH box helicase [Janthinobacterium aquaticum]|uniref:DEAD/DEAH box helicase n=1 Tax=Janthinobacterium sp. FT58W TaxID=2654254 RepID=UPI0012654867|nr:DEAD/DEAH box helicase family protein [Janthinobacterium sp. FT58W]KAB8042431.1 DEAD/DEAH box helicase [Janthinobacterium sp. FT58W]